MRSDRDGRGRCGARTLLSFAVLALALTSIQCKGGTAVQMTPEESAQALGALTTWLECEECEEGELEAVRKYGEAVVPNLAAVASGGLAPASRALVREQLEARYDALAEQGRRDTAFAPRGTRDEFVALYLGNLDAQYRIRAARALGAIGGARARSALERAMGRTQREDVRTAMAAEIRRAP
jgi:hypothetical protein